jgi:hypothetical protein
VGCQLVLYFCLHDSKVWKNVFIFHVAQHHDLVELAKLNPLEKQFSNIPLNPSLSHTCTLGCNHEEVPLHLGNDFALSTWKNKIVGQEE